MGLGHAFQDLVNHVGPVLLDVGLDLGELLVGGFIDGMLVGRRLALVLREVNDV